MISDLLPKLLHPAGRLAAKVRPLLQSGQFDDADRLVDAGLLRFPTNDTLLELHALVAHNSARYAPARDRWDRLRNHRPAIVMAWAGGACNRRELGDNDGAAELILEAFERFPRNALLLGEAHRIFLKLKPGEARTRLKSILLVDAVADETHRYARAFTLPPGLSPDGAPRASATGGRPSDIVEALSLLTPYETNKRKVRVGPAEDGGYVLLDMLDPEQSVVSYGIGFQYDFDREMASRGHKVYMFDHTILPLDPPDPNMLFFGEGLAGRSRPEANVYSLADHLERHGIEGNRLILKMDAEGAEFEAIDTADEDVLARFEQMSIEFHFLGKLDNPAFREIFLRVFAKINAQFTLFHVHANNGGGPDTFAFVGGLPVPNLLELSFVRTSSIVRRPNETAYPTDIDFPCHEARDLRLWIYPFLPAVTDVETLRRSWEFTELLSAGFGTST